MEQDFSGSLAVADGFPVEEKGFFEYGSRRTINTEGEEITARAMLYLLPDSAYDASHPQWRFEDVKSNQTMTLATPDVIDDPRTGNTHHYELGLI